MRVSWVSEALIKYICFGSLIDLTRLSRTPTARKATDDARMMLKIQNLIEELKCFETVRSRRWPDGVTCPHWASSQGITQGHDDTRFYPVD